MLSKPLVKLPKDTMFIQSCKKNGAAFMKKLTDEKVVKLKMAAKN